MRKNRNLAILLLSVIVFAFLFLLRAKVTSDPGSRATGANKKGDLIFNEEFDSQTLDHKWTKCFWWGDQGCTIQSNNELEWYTPGNVSLQDGALQLTAKRQSVKGTDGKTYPYTSGMVTTGPGPNSPALFDFKYGFVEARAWVPKGPGLLPAIWMLPADKQPTPEIDIMEILGSNPQTLHMNLHYVSSSGTSGPSNGQWTSPAALTGGWHTFALDWEPDRITWYVDGIQRREFTETSLIPAKPMYLIMNLAVGGDWPGSPDANTPFPSTFKIDYVRVWKSGGTVEQSPAGNQDLILPVERIRNALPF